MEESRIVVVTGITTMMWLLVTFLTKDESPLVRSRMLPFVGAAKDHFPKFALALMLGFLMVGMNYLIWRGILH
jgi:hypothetical protein